MPDIDLSLLDGAIIAVIMAGAARGIFSGMIREGASIAALGAAVLAVRFGATPTAEWLTTQTSGQIGAAIAPWITGSIIGVATVGFVGTLGNIVRRGARFAGLGLVDRMGGAALGAAEGFLVGMLIVLGATLVIGREHPAVEQSRSLEAYDTVRAMIEARTNELPEVAAPGDW